MDKSLVVAAALRFGLAFMALFGPNAFGQGFTETTPLSPKDISSPQRYSGLDGVRVPSQSSGKTNDPSLLHPRRLEDEEAQRLSDSQDQETALLVGVSAVLVLGLAFFVSKGRSSWRR